MACVAVSFDSTWTQPGERPYWQIAVLEDPDLPAGAKLCGARLALHCLGVPFWRGSRVQLGAEVGLERSQAYSDTAELQKRGFVRFHDHGIEIIPLSLRPDFRTASPDFRTPRPMAMAMAREAERTIRREPAAAKVPTGADGPPPDAASFHEEGQESGRSSKVACDSKSANTLKTRPEPRISSFNPSTECFSATSLDSHPNHLKHFRYLSNGSQQSCGSSLNELNSGYHGKDSNSSGDSLTESFTQVSTHSASDSVRSPDARAKTSDGGLRSDLMSFFNLLIAIGISNLLACKLLRPLASADARELYCRLQQDLASKHIKRPAGYARRMLENPAAYLRTRVFREIYKQPLCLVCKQPLTPERGSAGGCHFECARR